MAAGDLTYGQRTQLADVTRLNSDANNYATAFGEIDNTTDKAYDREVHIVVPINASATSGSFDLYAVSSQDGAEWTDNIDPATDTDYADFVKDARLVKSAPTIYDNSPSGARTEVEFHFNILDIFSSHPKYVGFVLVNKSGYAVGSSGSDGDHLSIKIATS